MALSKFSFRRKCPVFETYPEDFSGTQLPTHKDVLLCCLFERQRLGQERGTNKEPCFSEIAEIVSCKIENIFNKTSIPTVTHTRVLQLLRAYHDKYTLLKKVNVSKRTPGEQDKREKFVASAEAKLFDISFCKCPQFSSCNCPKDKKVPLIEQPFLLDQRTNRIGRIGKVDVAETKKLIKRTERKIQEINRKSVHTTSSSGSCLAGPSTDEDVKDVFSASRKRTQDESFQPSKRLERETSSVTKQNTIKLEHTALAAQRFGVSSRVGRFTTF